MHLGFFDDYVQFVRHGLHHHRLCSQAAMREVGRAEVNQYGLGLSEGSDHRQAGFQARTRVRTLAIQRQLYAFHAALQLW